MSKKELFPELPPTYILEAHYDPSELKELRKTLETHGCQVTSSIFQAELIITKLTQEKRIRLEIQEVLKKRGATTGSTKDLDVVKDRWIRKCVEEGKLIDWPFTDSKWRIAHIAAIEPISPPGKRSKPESFVVPGTPPSKLRKLSRSGSDLTTKQERPSVPSAPSFDSSSDDPSSKHFHPPSQTTVTSEEEEMEEDDRFDYRDVYACRRRTPLISRNEKFVEILLEIKLARELAL